MRGIAHGHSTARPGWLTKSSSALKASHGGPRIVALMRLLWPSSSARDFTTPSREVPEHSEGRQLVDPLGRIFVTLWRFVFGCRVWSSKLHFT